MKEITDRRRRSPDILIEIKKGQVISLITNTTKKIVRVIDHDTQDESVDVIDYETDVINNSFDVITRSLIPWK